MASMALKDRERLQVADRESEPKYDFAARAAKAPGREELIKAARDLRPILAERAMEAERSRRISNETFSALVEKGFLNFLVPRKWGGHGGDVSSRIEIAAELAKGCASTAWVFSIVGGITAMAGAYLTAEGQRAIFESGEAPLACGVNSFTGTAKSVDGGYVVSGSWGFASGCLHSNWFLGGTLVVDEKGKMLDSGFFLTPMSTVAIKDTWHVAGMCGTGSNTVVASEVFIPKHLFITLAERHEQEANPKPEATLMERMPFSSWFSVGLVATCLGTTEAAYELVSTNVHTRGVSYFEFPKQTDSAALIEGLGEARLMIDTAWLHMRRGAETLNKAADGPLHYNERARCRADAGHAVENLRKAMDMLLNIGGASSFADSNPLQRYWRDLSVASRHAFLNSRGLYEAYGRAELGLQPNITRYI